MGYRVTHQTAFERRFKKCPPDLQTEVLDVVAPQIVNDPLVGDPLKGNWKHYQSWHFHRKPEYRIVYRVYECKVDGDPPSCDLQDHTDCLPDLNQCSGLIDFVLIGTREEFNRLYKLRQKDIDQFSL